MIDELRIAMLLSTPLPPREGIGYYAWNLANNLKQMDQTVNLITRGCFRGRKSQRVNNTAIYFPFFFPIYPFHVHTHRFFVMKLIRRLESEIDIFHLHTPLVPYLETKRPVLLTFHSSIPANAKLTKNENFYSILVKMQSTISYHLELLNISHATVVTAVSPWVADHVQQYPNAPKNIEVMWNGVDTEIFKPSEIYDRNRNIVLTVCRLESEKGLYDLLKAAEIVIESDPDICFWIVGDGRLRKSLFQRIRNLHLEQRIILFGQITDRKYLISLYQKASLFVLPSHHESFPTVLLESMACGCPVLASRIGGIPYLIDDGKNGILFSPGDILDLAEKIAVLLSNPDYSNSISIKALHTIEDRFTWQQITSRYLQLYRYLL